MSVGFARHDGEGARLGGQVEIRRWVLRGGCVLFQRLKLFGDVKWRE